MASATIPKTCKVILADSIAKSLLVEVHNLLQEVQKAQGIDRQLCLAAFLANNDPAAVKYAEWSQKTCQEKYVFTVVNPHYDS